MWAQNGGTSIASVPFTVLVNTANSGWYATLAASQKVVRDNLKTIVAAIGSGNTSAIPAALRPRTVERQPQ